MESSRHGGMYPGGRHGNRSIQMKNADEKLDIPPSNIRRHLTGQSRRPPIPRGSLPPPRNPLLPPPQTPGVGIPGYQGVNNLGPSPQLIPRSNRSNNGPPTPFPGSFGRQPPNPSPSGLPGNSFPPPPLYNPPSYNPNSSNPPGIPSNNPTANRPPSLADFSSPASRRGFPPSDARNTPGPAPPGGLNRAPSNPYPGANPGARPLGSLNPRPGQQGGQRNSLSKEIPDRYRQNWLDASKWGKEILEGNA